MPYIQNKKNNILLIVLFLSGLFGCYIAIFNHSTWQVPVESGQVLAGIVKYPPNNPFYMYHLKLWSLLNQISALLLYFGISEKTVSIIISGLLGCISFQALSLVVFAFSRNAVLAVLSPFFIYFMNYVGYGIAYPIWLMGTKHSYGIFGLSSILLIIALISNGQYKYGGFFLGMAPAIHPPLGTFCILIVFIAFLWDYKNTQNNSKKLFKYFLFGCFISAISLTYQLYISRELPNIDPDISKDYISSFIKYWDVHRRPVNLRHPGIKICIMSLLISVLGLRFLRKELPQHSLFILRVIIVSAILSLALSLTTLMPPEIVPNILLISMPGRFMNLNNLAFVALLIGILGNAYSRDILFNKFILFVFVLCSLFLKNVVYYRPYYLILSLSMFLIASRFFSRRLHNFFNDKHKLINLTYRITLLLFVLIGATVLYKSTNNWETRKERFRNWSNDPVYAAISKGNGIILTAGNIANIQLLTRRPVLMDGSALDGISYVLEAAPELNNILDHIYGLNIFIPPDKYRNKPVIPNIHKELWESRTKEQWFEIKKQFGVSDILTYSDWKLDLPVIIQNKSYVLYRIN